jgi:hypothetical protein
MRSPNGRQSGQSHHLRCSGEADSSRVVVWSSTQSRVSRIKDGRAENSRDRVLASSLGSKSRISERMSRWRIRYVRVIDATMLSVHAEDVLLRVGVDLL